MANQPPPKLSVLIKQELLTLADAPSQSWWVAQIIEQDLATQARTLVELISEVEQLVLAYMSSGDQPEGALWSGPPAPADLRDRFLAAPVRLQRVDPSLPTNPGLELPEFEFRITA